MFPIGLAAVDQGYNQGAQAYWQRRQLEDQQGAYDALGKTFLAMQGGIPQGAPPPPVAGPQPMAPPPVMPPVGGMPQPGGVAQPSVGMPGGAPGGPPPGFINPRTAAGQPQNLTGPIVPPGGMPGGPPGGMLLRSPAPPMAPPGGGVGVPPGGPGGGTGGQPPQVPQQISSVLGQPPYDWRQVAATVAQANPNASPAVIARAVTMLMPFMQTESQQQWRQIQTYLAQERIDEAKRTHQATEDIRRSHEAGVEEERGRVQSRFETAEARRSQALQLATQKAQSTDAYRQAEAARRDLAGSDKRDEASRKRALDIAKQKYNIYDKALRAEINAATNLTGEDKKRAIAEAAKNKEDALSDLDSMAKSPDFNPPPGTPPRPSGPGLPSQSFKERFGDPGEAATATGPNGQKIRYNSQTGQWEPMK